MEKIQAELSDLQKRMTDNESKWTELSDMVIAKLESISDQLFQRYKKQSDESRKELSLKINLVEKEASSFKKQFHTSWKPKRLARPLRKILMI